MRRSRDVTRFCQLLCANTAPIRMMLVWMEETSRSTHSRGQPSTIIASASDQRQRLGLALRACPIARGASPRCQLFTGCSQAKPAAVTCGGNFLGRVISYVGTKPQSTGALRRFWHRWFAWRPVFIWSSRSGTRRLVWLEYLELKGSPAAWGRDGFIGG